MKKLFISCPMKGRTEENIKKSMKRMHKIAEIVFDQNLEVIPTLIYETPPEGLKNDSLWYLGESIKRMAEADFFIGVEWGDRFKGCNAEQSIALDYGIKCTFVDYKNLMPDIVELENQYYQTEVPVNC